MPKRVHELAKELKISTAALKKHLEDMGIKVKTHMSILDDETIAKVKAKFSQQIDAIKKKDESRKKIHQIISISKRKKQKKEKSRAKVQKEETPNENQEEKAVPSTPKKVKVVRKNPTVILKQKSKKPTLIQVVKSRKVLPITENHIVSRADPAVEKKRIQQKSRGKIKKFKETYTKSSSNIKRGKKDSLSEIKGIIHEKGKRRDSISKMSFKPAIKGTKEKKVYASKDKHLKAKLKHIKGKRSSKPIIDITESEISKNIKRVLTDPQKKKYKKEEKVNTLRKSKLIIRENTSIAELSKLMDIPANEIIKKLFIMGLMVTITQRLDRDTLEMICQEFDLDVDFEDEYGKDLLSQERGLTFDENAELHERPPIITLMGHVDHGKTSILDKIRSSNIVAKESGAITQHMGAYQVKYNDKKITFIDTPGHKAFTAMRSRGANVTDIVVIVVAANESVKAQTLEAIDHAKAAGVEIIVAINKIDLKDANIDRTINDLMKHNLYLENYGGEILWVSVSAKTGEGINELLDTILLSAEMKEYKTDWNAPAEGVVIKAEKSSTKGSMTSILIRQGVLKKGDIVVCGQTWGRVRKMLNDKQKEIKKLEPSGVAIIFGLNDVPRDGDKLNKVKNEKKAKEIATNRKMQQDEIDRYKSRVNLGNLFQKISESNMKEINLIIKGDTDGTIGAISDSIEKLNSSEVAVHIIRKSVGGITEADVELANASNAIILGFHVRASNNVKREADKKGVEIKLYQVIYDLLDDVKAAMSGMLEPELKEEIIGSSKVKKVYRIKKVGNIAGCYVESGKMISPSKIRLYRDNIQIFDGDMLALKHYNNDVKEVVAGSECGISLKNFNDIKENDVIECYIINEVKRTL